MKNWKTTTLGVLSILSAVIPGVTALIEGKSFDWSTVLPAVMAGWALIHAADSTPSTPNVKTVAPIAILALAIGLSLAVPGHARADDAAPSAPLTLKLNDHWTLRPNVTVGPLVGYSFAKRVWLTDVSIGGLYVADYDAKFCAGLGAALGFGTDNRPILNAAVLVGGPAWKLPTGSALRPALVGQYTAAGGDRDFRLMGTVSLSF